MGKNTNTATSMMNSVLALLDASQMVRLAFGTVDEGIKNGNSAMPAVNMVAAWVIPLDTSAMPLRLVSIRLVSNAVSTPAAGTSHSTG